VSFSGSGGGKARSSCQRVTAAIAARPTREAAAMPVLRKNFLESISAAPYPPAGTFSPLNGEKEIVAAIGMSIFAKAPYGALTSIMPVAVRAEYCGRYISSIVAAGWA